MASSYADVASWTIGALIVFLTVYYVKRSWTYYKEIHVILGTVIVAVNVLMPHLDYFKAFRLSFYYKSGIPIMILTVLEALMGIPLYFHGPYKLKRNVKKFIKRVHKVCKSREKSRLSGS